LGEGSKKHPWEVSEMLLGGKPRKNEGKWGARRTEQNEPKVNSCWGEKGGLSTHKNVMDDMTL